MTNSIQYLKVADGLSVRTGVFESQALVAQQSVCVVLHGQTEFIEKYDEVIAELNSRGFTVATIDWPGQGGSYRMLPNRLKAHIRDFQQYSDALDIFMRNVVSPLGDSAPIVLAHSMGGNILLRRLYRHPNEFRAAILMAPMLRALTRGYPRWLAYAFCIFENAIGNSEDWIWGMEDRDPFLVTFETQLVTSDQMRFEHIKAFLRTHPDLRLAGPTWGWLRAAYKSMSEVMSPTHAKSIGTPILMCVAGRDRIVDVGADREYATWLPHCELLDLEDAEHEILMENDQIRAQFWSAFDNFIRKR